MTTTTYIPTQRAIKVFAEGNRLDFLLEDPQAELIRESVFYSDINDVYQLAGKELQILPAEYDEAGNRKYPNRLSIRWGGQIINLGWTVPKSGGKSYFYRSLETANDRARPKTPDEVFAMLDFGQ